MLKKLYFRFGKTEDSQHLSLDMTPVTVFVGPNNSGKSKALQEIRGICSGGEFSQTNVVVEKVEFVDVGEKEAGDKISRVELKPNYDEIIADGHVIVGKRGHRLSVPVSTLKQSFANPNEMRHQFCQWYLVYNTLLLDGKSRISLVNEQSAGDLLSQPHTSLHALFCDDDKRKEVRRIIHDAFGLYFVIDPTNIGKFRIKLSSVEPASIYVEQGLHEESREYYKSSIEIDHMSDGVKAFTGMITEIVAGDPVVVLIDEPEAFLHPALAFKLGKEISTTSMNSNKNVVISTHSPYFVMGCIHSGAAVNIVRLTYRGNVATARALPCDEILQLMRNPLLRSTGVLSALFYENVVITEGDADRAFYQEVNERLLSCNSEFGIPNCLFLNAQNKQTIETIMRPLRRLGIPTAAIVDVDIIKEGGKNWSSFLSAGGIQEMAIHSWATLRTSLMQKIKDIPGDKDFKKNGGIYVLDQQSQESASTLIDNLARYGLFIIKGGELESWLKYLGVGKHGPNWLIDVFSKMGDDPSLETYIKPTNGDVWKFMGQIKTWLLDPQRKGIPK